MFLEQQISISEWFLKDDVTEDWSNGGWKFSFAITEINYILKYITNYFYYNISQYYSFYYILIKYMQPWCTLEAFKNIKNLNNPKLLNGSSYQYMSNVNLKISYMRVWL